MRPRIGVTSPLPLSSLDETAGQEVRRHVHLLQSLGADPTILARGDATANALEGHGLSGVLFSGGGDVAASLYGGRVDLCWDRVDPERDSGELALLRNAFARRVPSLCICRGMQLVNVAFGGTLIEDVKTELGDEYRIAHHQLRELGKRRSDYSHEVRILARSALRQILGVESIQTNSIHHQAIRDLAAPFKPSARTNEGIIEAIELAAPEFFFIGVQWHPESLASDEVSIRLYSAFVEAASRVLIPESGMRED